MGMIIIFSFLLIAILGPTIRPDATSKANQQHLELSRKEMGFTVKVLYQKKRLIEEQSVFKSWIYGFPKKYNETPIYGYELKDNILYYETFTGNLPNEGENFILNLNNKTFGIGNEAEIFIDEKVYWMGTDRYGRDLMSRLMAGTWISFSVGFISILISLFIGITLGSIAGYYGGRVDDFIMWLINVIWSIPTLLLVIAMTLALGKGFWQVFVAVGLTMWVEVARVVRGQVIGKKQMEFIEAGKSFGFRNSRIILKHVLPNVTGPIIVISASNFAGAILIEAGLSFLGLGAQPPQATWGKMISEHKGYIITGDAYLAILPGIAICLLVLSFVLLGNGLRDAFDTKGVKNLSI